MFLSVCVAKYCKYKMLPGWRLARRTPPKPQLPSHKRIRQNPSSVNTVWGISTLIQISKYV